MARLPIQIFEYEKLTIHADKRERKLEPSELVKLLEFNDKNDNTYFTAIRDGVKFKNYVGVIQIGGLTIEILPKADNNISDPGDTDYNDWHSVLLNMLRVCKRINVASMSEANLKKKHHSLLDLYFEMYLDEIENLLRLGLVKNYRKDSKNVFSLKGRLDFNKNIQQNLVHQERFYTNHQVYDYQNLINQIILKGLTILDTIVHNSFLKDKIKRIKSNFPDIKEIPILKTHFDKISQNRKTVSYVNVLQIAKMIILNYSPDIRTGQENMLTLLFDMNKLWEEYIYRMLKRVNGEDILVDFQNKQEFWENRTIRPDLVITKPVNGVIETYVIDTKWKVLDVFNPKPSDDDLKQMFAYNLYWGAKRSMLLYPNSQNINEKFGNFHKGREVNQCKVGFVNVMDDSKKLNLNIGEEILAKLKY